MNRFATFAVLALAAFAVSTNAAPSVDQSLDNEETTQWNLQVSDDVELQGVREAGLEIFNDFCTSTRDYILDDIKTKTGQMSSQGFRSFFSMAEEVANHALSANQDATSKLGAQLANPSGAVDGDDDIAQAQRQIAGESQPLALLTAVRGAMGATMSAVATVVEQKINAAKSLLNIAHWIKLAESGCDQAALYEEELKERFQAFQDSVRNSQNGEKYASLTMEAIPCVTSSRIVRANGICGFVKVSVEPTKKMLAPYFNRELVRDAVAQ